MSLRRAGPTTLSDVTLTGLATYVQGDIITGAANLRALRCRNGFAGWSYAVRAPDVQRGSHMLEMNTAAGYVEVLDAEFGDYAYFISSIAVIADRAVVVELSDDAVEVAFQWDVHPHTAVALYDQTGSPNYNNVPAVKTSSSCRLQKTLRVQRGEPGYYVGWHSTTPTNEPDVGLVPSRNNDTGWGEREIGIGGGAAVCWSSSGNVARWPAWIDDLDGRWTAAGLAATANKVWWPGIDDPTYLPAAWNPPLSPAGFPAEQANGPFYIADIHHDTVTVPYARLLATRQKLEMGAWQIPFSTAVAWGSPTVHMLNAARSPAGTPYRHMAFIGAIAYAADSSSAFANEPKASIQASMLALATNLRWPST